MTANSVATMDSENKVADTASQKETSTNSSSDGNASIADKGKDRSATGTSAYEQPKDGSTTPLAPASPNFYASFGTCVDPAAAAEAYQQAMAVGYDHSESAAYGSYVYPMSPQFQVQYYADYSGGNQSYPGTPPMQPQSPPFSPASPYFNPTSAAVYYPSHPQGISGITLASPPTHPYILPPHMGQPFPPIHISSPVLSGTMSAPNSPPYQHLQRLPGPFIPNPNVRGNQYSGRHSVTHHVQPPQPNANQQQANQSPQNQGQTHNLNIYIRGLHPSITDEALYDMCLLYGKITSSKAIIDQKTGECKGYGFVMYETEEQAQQAIDALNQAGFQVSFAKVGQESFSTRLKNLQDENSTNIYISNLPVGMTEQQLEDMCQPYKTVSSRILRDPQTGLSRGVGFSRMIDRPSAQAVITQFNGHTLAGSTVPLQVRFANSMTQKKLKGQTVRKRMWRAREYQNMQSFGGPLQMPVTPETMLGIGSSTPPHIHGVVAHPGYYPEGVIARYAGQPFASHYAVGPQGVLGQIPLHQYYHHVNHSQVPQPPSYTSGAVVEPSSAVNNTPLKASDPEELTVLVEKLSVGEGNESDSK